MSRIDFDEMYHSKTWLVEGFMVDGIPFVRFIDTRQGVYVSISVAEFAIIAGKAKEKWPRDWGEIFNVEVMER